ncbi:hypothetical protein [Streptomyces fungicidicus]|uniref:hypothetical protein n=1 Tax=Streptomyces fungicidicus TaxID=68203 RepID=UPI0038129ED0
MRHCRLRQYGASAEPSGTVGSSTGVRGRPFQSSYCTTIIRLIIEISGIVGTETTSWNAYFTGYGAAAMSTDLTERT